MTEETKVCKECGRDLPLDKFMKSRWGVTSICKECAEKKKSETRLKAAAVEVPEGSTAAAERAAPAAVLDGVSDDALISELRARGWKGQLSKQVEVVINM